MKGEKIKGEAFTTEPGIFASRKTHLNRDSWRDVLMQSKLTAVLQASQPSRVKGEIGQASSSRPFAMAARNRRF